MSLPCLHYFFFFSHARFYCLNLATKLRAVNMITNMTSISWDVLAQIMQKKQKHTTWFSFVFDRNFVPLNGINLVFAVTLESWCILIKNYYIKLAMWWQSSINLRSVDFFRYLHNIFLFNWDSFKDTTQFVKDY